MAARTQFTAYQINYDSTSLESLSGALAVKLAEHGGLEKAGGLKVKLLTKRTYGYDDSGLVYDVSEDAGTDPLRLINDLTEGDGLALSLDKEGGLGSNTSGLRVVTGHGISVLGSSHSENSASTGMVAVNYGDSLTTYNGSDSYNMPLNIAGYSSATENQILTKGASGVEWKDPGEAASVETSILFFNDSLDSISPNSSWTTVNIESDTTSVKMPIPANQQIKEMTVYVDG